MDVLGSHLRGVVIIEPQKRTRVLKPTSPLGEGGRRWQFVRTEESLDSWSRDSRASVSFCGTELRRTEEDSIRVSVEELKDEWVDFGHQRTATFLNLDHGDYTFEVRSRNKYGVYSPYVSSVQLSIRPKLTERPLFYFGVGVLVVLLGLTLHRVRIRTMEEREAAQERLLKERTRELEDTNRRLQEQSFIDALTKIRNRRYVYDVIPNYLATIDRELFEAKARGDSMMGERRYRYGLHHARPRQVQVDQRYLWPLRWRLRPQEVNKILQKVGRLTDTIARWGGEEFILIARNTGRAKAHILAERIRQAFSRAYV